MKGIGLFILYLSLNQYVNKPVLLKDFAKIFFTILVLHLVVIDVGESQMLIYLTKPLLLLSLIAFYRHRTQSRHAFERLFLGGLVFSLVGDVLLMLPGGELYFLLGLGAFFIAQLLYTLAYIKELGGNSGLVKQKPYLAIPLLLLGVALVFVLKDGLGQLVLPVIGYATVITAMAVAALNRQPVVSAKGFWLVFGGALFFIISDASIAFGKFVGPFPLERIVVMSTYGVAQFMMVWGMISSQKPT